MNSEAGSAGFDLASLWQPVIDRWKMVLAIPVSLALLVLLAQAIQTPTYTSALIVAPTREAVAGADGLPGGLSNLAAAAGVKVGEGGTVSEFERFRFMLHSVRLAEHQAQTRNMLPIIFEKDWDAAQEQWIPPSGPVAAVKGLFYPLFGLPAWLEPDARDLARHYKDRLKASEVGETGLVQIRYEHKDPERARKILAAVVEDANMLTRTDARDRAESRAIYLRQQLQQAQVAEYRTNLASMLAQEEQTLMLASTGLPYAAETVEPVNVSRAPTSQRPLLYSVIAFILGLSVAMFLAITLGTKPGFREAETGKASEAPEA